MSINRFDVYAEQPNNQSYYQLPYNELAAGLLSKQKRYDEEAAKLAEQEVGLGKILDSRWTQGISKEIQDSYLPRIQELSSGQIDLTTPEGKQRANLLTAEIAKDERIKLAALGMAKQTQWEQLRAKDPNANMAALADVDAQGNPIQWKNATGKWDSKSGNTFDVFNSFVPYADMDKEILQLTSNIKADLVSKLQRDGTTIEYDEATDKYFKIDKLTKQRTEEIGPGHPQFDSAMKATFQQFELGNTPATNYFKTKYKYDIAQNPDFGNSYVKNLVDRVKVKRTEESDESKITPISGAGSGKKKGKEEEGTGISPRVETVIGTTLDLRKGTNPFENYQASKQAVESFTNDLKASGKQVVTNSETGLLEIVKPDNITIAEQNQIDQLNSEYENIQRDFALDSDLNRILAEKYGLNPENIYENVSQEILDKAEEIYNQKINFPGAVGVGLKPEQILQNANKAKLDYLKSQGKENIGKYLKEFDELIDTNGITLKNVNAYPLTKEIFNDDIANTFAVLQNSANYGTLTQGGFVEYANTNKAITEDDKEFITKYLADKSYTDLKGRTAIMQDPERGGAYSVIVTIPREKGDPLLIKVPDTKLPTLSTTAKQEIDNVLHSDQLQKFREHYYKITEKSKGIHGEIKGSMFNIPVTHLPFNETVQQANLNWGKVAGPPIQLEKGDGIFTLPKMWGGEGLIFKTGGINDSYTFINAIEAFNVQKGGDRQNMKVTPTEILELAKSNGIQPINAPGLYKRYYKDIRIVSPK